MPALPSWIIGPLWDQVAAVLPEHHDPHPLGCHRPRIPDRVIFDKLLQVVVFGCAYQRIADHTCSARTLRRRRDEWITAGVMDQVHQLALVGLCQVDARDRLSLTESSDMERPVKATVCLVDGMVCGQRTGRVGARDRCWVAVGVL